MNATVPPAPREVIPLEGEQLYTLHAIRDVIVKEFKLPNPPDYHSLFRWRQHGIGGVKLETVRYGRYVYTSAEAVRRFLAKINARPASPVAGEVTARARTAGEALKAALGE